MHGWAPRADTSIVSMGNFQDRLSFSILWKLTEKGEVGVSLYSVVMQSH